VRQEGTSRHHVMTLDVPLLNRTVQSTAEDVPNPSQSVTYAGFAGNDVKRQLSLTHHRKPKRDMRLRHSPAGRSPQTTTQRVSVVRWSSTSAACSHVRFSSHLSTVLVAATLCNVHRLPDLYRFVPGCRTFSCYRSQTPSSRQRTHSESSLRPNLLANDSD